MAPQRAITTCRTRSASCTSRTPRSRPQRRGTPPAPGGAEAAAPGTYPARQWIASPNFSSRLGLAIRYIVIHDMEGTQPGAIAVFKSPARQASAHYLMRARDGHIVQMVH